MADNLSELDIRCSNSCTRSGLTVLVLSIFAFVMLEPLTKTRQLEALIRYMSVRNVINEELNQLETDPVWKDLNSSDLASQASKDWNLAQLLDYRVKSSSGATDPTSSKDLSAPTELRVYANTEILPIHSINQMLDILGDGNLLKEAQHYSIRYNRSIYRWSKLRDRLLLQNSSKIGNIPAGTVSKAEGKEKHNVSISVRDILRKYLTLPQIIELANYEEPDVSEIDFLIKESGKITFPWIGMPLGLRSGALFVEIGLLVSTLYFWLYYREARLSNNFPAHGTLFGVFARTRSSEIMFKAFLCVPPIAACLLAYRSFWATPINSFLAGLVLLSVLLIKYKESLSSTK